MKVLHVGIFNDHELGGDIIFEKGLRQNGCDVERFDYRSVLASHGKDRLQQLLVDCAANKDLVFIGKGEALDRRTLAQVRRRGVLTVLWYGDIRPQPEPWLIDLLGEVDCFFMSSGDWELRRHFEQGRPGCAAYYFPPVDPELPGKFGYLPRGTLSIVFTGTAHHYADMVRQETINYLKRRGDVRFFGGAQFQNSLLGVATKIVHRLRRKSLVVRGEAYVAAIKSGRIGVGVNAIQGVPRYTSDRLSHYLTFGTFYLASHFPEIEKLFEYGSELVWFRDVPDLNQKLAFYLNESSEREEIAARGQRRVLESFNTRAIVGMMLDIAKTGSSQRFEWVEVYR